MLSARAPEWGRLDGWGPALAPRGQISRGQHLFFGGSRTTRPKTRRWSSCIVPGPQQRTSDLVTVEGQTFYPNADGVPSREGLNVQLSD